MSLYSRRICGFVGNYDPWNWQLVDLKGWSELIQILDSEKVFPKGRRTEKETEIKVTLQWKILNKIKHNQNFQN